MEHIHFPRTYYEEKPKLEREIHAHDYGILAWIMCK